jgi:iron complex outermembrane receptor protein
MDMRQALGGAGAAILVGATLSLNVPVAAQTAPPTELPEVRVEAQKPRPKKRPRQQASPQRAPSVPVTATQPQPDQQALGAPAAKQKYQLPQTSAGITAARIQEQVNVVDTQDAVKYLPSLFVRKRNYGDNQSVLATRTTGLGASARSLIYADDILLSSLIANNNTLGVPRWGLVAPEEISRVDFLYGPFSAAYPGNSEGGVLLITTRMPEKLEVTAKQTEAFQTFSRYKTSDTYRTDQTSLSVGDKQGRFSYFISGNYQNSYSQPLAWVTTASNVPAGVTGVIPQSGRIPGTRADVVGAGGLLHTEQANIKGKFAYDVTPWVTAAYTVALWTNDQDSKVQTYLRDSAGNPTFGGVSGFAGNNYTWDQTHLANAVSLKSDTKGLFDFDISASRYDFLQDIQRLPFSVTATGAGFTPYGKISRLDGTNWMNSDANFIWRPNDEHNVSFGFHADRYELNNPTYQTPNWVGGPDETNSLYSNGLGKSRTMALWAQDAWRFAENWKLTTGVRLEDWRAYDGFNLFTQTNNTVGSPANGNITASQSTFQPELNATRASPKLSLAYEPSKQWLATVSIGQASRFPTVAELYQAVSTNDNTIAIPNPNLKPEEVLSEEIALERRFTDGKVRLSVFNENGRNTLISQLVALNDGTTRTGSLTTNVDKTRITGVELAAQKDNVLIDRLEVFGSITYADARIVSDPSFIGTNGSTANGKRIPNIPAWRVTSGVTYRPDDLWSVTAAMRYASKQYSTLDNTDTVTNVFQAFDSYLVVDLRVQRKLTDNATVSFGIDNVGNASYTLFHPFPQRTYVADVRVKF